MKLPENFEREYFSLLTPIVTDGTLKNRRNLLVASFSISLLYILNKPLSDLSILGIKLQGSNSKTILIATLILILFWGIMFCIHATKDAQINKERRHLLLKHSEKLKKHLDNITDKFQHLDDGHPNKNQITTVKKNYEVFELQKNGLNLQTR